MAYIIIWHRSVFPVNISFPLRIIDSSLFYNELNQNAKLYVKSYNYNVNGLQFAQTNAHVVIFSAIYKSSLTFEKQTKSKQTYSYLLKFSL